MSNFNFRRLSFLLLSILGIMPVVADDNNKVDLTPELHGVIRPRWEMDTKGGGKPLSAAQRPSECQRPSRTGNRLLFPS